MVDVAFAIQEHSQRICESHASSLRGFDTVFNCDSVVSEERVSTNAVSLMRSDVVANFVCNVALVTVVGLSYIVRVLRLIEITLSTVAVPNKHISESVLTRKTIASHVVTVHLETGI